MVKQRVYQGGEGRLAITMLLTVTDEGLVVQVFGGDKPHVGAVALSVPRPSLKEHGETSCNTIVIPLIGHKDDEIAKPVAEAIVKEWKNPVVVVAGVHLAQAGPEEIEALINNCREATGRVIADLPFLK